MWRCYKLTFVFHKYRQYQYLRTKGFPLNRYTSKTLLRTSRGHLWLDWWKSDSFPLCRASLSAKEVKRRRRKDKGKREWEKEREKTFRLPPLPCVRKVQKKKILTPKTQIKKKKKEKICEKGFSFFSQFHLPDFQLSLICCGIRKGGEKDISEKAKSDFFADYLVIWSHLASRTHTHMGTS